MTLEISIPKQQPVVLLQPKITVIGIGGAGGNAINNMIRSKLDGVTFAVANTDAQSLSTSLADSRVQLGIETTKGQGAGARPEVGKESAEESLDALGELLNETHMLFITAGMGGGTGTGAAPVVAKLAQERGILTVGVVTKPFSFEGKHRMQMAEEGIEELAQHVDTLIVIPNQNLFLIADEKMTFADSFKRADQVLQEGVRSITDLILIPGLINLDFADVRTVMAEMGRAMMGTGKASGENRALDAAEAAIANPLLDDASMAGAKGILINISGGDDLTLFEVDEAANRIRREVDSDANIIFGAGFDESLQGSIRVSVVATGIARPKEVTNPFAPQNSSLFSASSHGSSTSFSHPVTGGHRSNTGASAPLNTVPRPSSFVPPAPEVIEEIIEEPYEPILEESELTQDILTLDEDFVPPLDAPQPVYTQTQSFKQNPLSVSSSLPTMPSAKELFTGAPETPSFQAHGNAFQRPVVKQELPHAPKQEDLFPAPAVIVSVPKSLEKEKQRPSIFQRVTGLKLGGSAVPEDDHPHVVKKSQEMPLEEDLDIPAFLRHRS